MRCGRKTAGGADGRACALIILRPLFWISADSKGLSAGVKRLEWTQGKKTPVLRFGFGGLFLFGLFFLLFCFVLVADEFQDGHLGVVADAMARLDDANIAARPVSKLRRNFAEEFLSDGRQ